MNKTHQLYAAAAPLARACGFALILFATGLSHGQALPPEEISPGGPRYQADEVLVQFKADVTDQQMTGAFRQGRLGLIKHIQTPAMKAHGRIGITRTATILSVPETIRLLNQLPGVEFAEPNWVLTKAYKANDPFYLDGALWGMFSDDAPVAIGPASTSNPFGTQAEKAWAAGFVGAPDVFVGIIDGGIQYTHPDLAANIWTNPGEIRGNGIDDDGNGYVDDVHGWSASDNSGNVSNVDDTDVHGTHVAGTIGAVGGNGLGVAGVNWNVTMIPGVLFGRGTATTVDAIEAIDYMTNLKTRKGLNLVALNNSWGGGGFSQTLLDAFTRAAQAGILSVAAAGNGATNIDVSPFFYPATYNTSPAASYDAIISVAAIGPAGTLSSFSNYGQNTVDLSAPGGERVDVSNPALHDPAYEIWSTVPTSGYGYSRGTSMSAPHVTGAIALYASTHPGSTAAQTRYDLLTAGIRPLAALQGLTVTGGTLDIGTLMAVPANGLPAPAAPANLQATAVSSTRVDLSWPDQSNNELGFALERSTDGVTYYLADTVGAADVN